MPVPAEATPQPGERFLPLPSAPSPLGQLILFLMNHLSSHAQYTRSSLEQFIDNGALVLGRGIIDSKGELKM